MSKKEIDVNKLVAEGRTSITTHLEAAIAVVVEAAITPGVSYQDVIDMVRQLGEDTFQDRIKSRIVVQAEDAFTLIAKGLHKKSEATKEDLFSLFTHYQSFKNTLAEHRTSNSFVDLIIRDIRRLNEAMEVFGFKLI